MEFLTRFKNALFLIMVLLTQAIALAVQVRRPVDPAEPDGPSVRLIRLWGTAAVTPFEVSAHAIGTSWAMAGRTTSICATYASRIGSCSRS
jgi:hypothetical protein